MTPVKVSVVNKKRSSIMCKSLKAPAKTPTSSNSPTKVKKNPVTVKTILRKVKETCKPKTLSKKEDEKGEVIELKVKLKEALETNDKKDVEILKLPESSRHVYIAVAVSRIFRQ